MVNQLTFDIDYFLLNSKKLDQLLNIYQDIYQFK